MNHTEWVITPDDICKFTIPESAHLVFITMLPFFIPAWTSLVGSQSGELSNWQFNSPNTKADFQARLFNADPGWLLSPVENEDTYMIVYLANTVVINGIITQGSGTEAVWVKSYKLMHSMGMMWSPLKDGNIIMVRTLP